MQTYLSLLNNGTGLIVSETSNTGLLWGRTGSSATISRMYSIYLKNIQKYKLKILPMTIMASYYNKIICNLKEY